MKINKTETFLLSCFTKPCVGTRPSGNAPEGLTPSEARLYDTLLVHSLNAVRKGTQITDNVRKRNACHSLVKKGLAILVSERQTSVTEATGYEYVTKIQLTEKGRELASSLLA